MLLEFHSLQLQEHFLTAKQEQGNEKQLEVGLLATINFQQFRSTTACFATTGVSVAAPVEPVASDGALAAAVPVTKVEVTQEPLASVEARFCIAFHG